MLPRLDLARCYHRVVVLEGGRVVEAGTYQELMAKGGVFRHLAAQAGLTA